MTILVLHTFNNLELLKKIISKEARFVYAEYTRQDNVISCCNKPSNQGAQVYLCGFAPHVTGPVFCLFHFEGMI